MLSFKSFLSEGIAPDFDHERNIVGHGDNPREFWENLIMPSHVYNPKSLKESIKSILEHEEHTLQPAHHIRDYLKQVSDSGNVLGRMRKGAEAAFPEGEHEGDRIQKAKEAVGHWQAFKRKYEENENMKRGFENDSIDRRNAEAAEHNKTATKKTAKKVESRKKTLSLGNGTELMSSNGKYDPEKHVGAGAAGKKVKILGLALAPHKVAGGLNVCPKATKGCAATCLALHAGMNQGEERNYHLKVARSKFLQEHPEHAVRMLSNEIQKHQLAAKKKGYEPAIRINANSDINYEHILPKAYWDKFGRGGKHEVKHYDYTKVAGRMNSPAKQEELDKKGYHLTLSSTGTGHVESNDKEVSKHLEKGGNVAMVFRMRKKGVLPHTVIVHHPNGETTAHPVHNANDRDDRYNDEIHHPASENHKHMAFLEANPHIQKGHGRISGLTFKGNTDKDMESTEFAVDANDGFSHINGHRTEATHEHSK
jgi:hypothetical protein